MPDKLITMTELGKRWGISRQGAAKLARTNPTFPETVKRGRTVTVSWRKAKLWREKQKQAELDSAMATWAQCRLSSLRAQLYRFAQKFDGRYAYLHTSKALTIDGCHDLAFKWHLNLVDDLERPDGRPTDYDFDPEYYDSEEYREGLEISLDDLRL